MRRGGSRCDGESLATSSRAWRLSCLWLCLLFVIWIRTCSPAALILPIPDLFKYLPGHTTSNDMSRRWRRWGVRVGREEIEKGWNEMKKGLLLRSNWSCGVRGLHGFGGLTWWGGSDGISSYSSECTMTTLTQRGSERGMTTPRGWGRG